MTTARNPNFDIRVTLDTGIIRGFKYFQGDGTFTTRFLGVPYAASPTGMAEFLILIFDIESHNFVNQIRFFQITKVFWYVVSSLIIKQNKCAPFIFTVH